MAVLVINAVMFFVEGAAGILSASTALLADSLDMLADALVYSIGLYAIGRSLRWRAGAALANGTFETLLGLAIAVQAIFRISTGIVPEPVIMGVVGGLALIANLACFALLARYREGEINLRATWVCSRNDVIGNVGVLIAGGLVALTGSLWPDVIIGLLIAFLIVKAAGGIAIEAARQLKTPSPIPDGASK